MAEFYGRTLGLKPLHSRWPDSWAEFDTGGATLALHAIPKEIAAHIEISSPPQPRESSPVKLVFVVDDVERERTRLAASGVTMFERPWGSCDGIDPEGNVFQLRAHVESYGRQA